MYYFIVNISGGSGKVKKTWIRVRNQLNKRNVKYKAFQTKGPEHAKALAGKISGLNEDDIHIVVVGGDGTINEVINGIGNFEKITLSVIPSGSGNDFARGLGISKNPIEALNRILDPKGEIKKIDLGCLTVAGKKRLFGISSGIGLDAIVCKKALDSKIKKVLNKFNMGSLTYLILTVISLFSMRYIDTEIEIYDEEDDTSGHTSDSNGLVLKEKLKLNKMIFSAFMNVKAEGGGVPMAPNALYDDGKLSLCIASNISKLNAFVKLPMLVMAKQEKIKGFDLIDARKVVVKIKEPAVVHVDGEYVGDEKEVTVEAIKGILRIK